MSYDVSGEFIEACNCYSDCPCWAGGSPHEGACAGLVAWRIGEGSRIGDVDVSGRSVVAVSAQTGDRHGGDASTAIFVDSSATDEQADELIRAFAGELDGPLCDLAAVNGAVTVRGKADITIAREPTAWQVTVNAFSTQDLVDAAGEPRPGNTHSSHPQWPTEMGVAPGSSVHRQDADHVAVHVSAIGAGVKASGGTSHAGTFVYRLPG